MACHAVSSCRTPPPGGIFIAFFFRGAKHGQTLSEGRFDGVLKAPSPAHVPLTGPPRAPTSVRVPSPAESIGELRSVVETLLLVTQCKALGRQDSRSLTACRNDQDEAERPLQLFANRGLIHRLLRRVVGVCDTGLVKEALE